MKTFPQLLVNVKVSDKHHVTDNPVIKEVIEQVEAELNESKAKLGVITRELSSVQKSVSWLLTSPLRKTRKLFSKLNNLISR